MKYKCKICLKNNKFLLHIYLFILLNYKGKKKSTKYFLLKGI